MAEVALSHLTRSFATSVPAGLFDLSLTIPSGELLAVVGPSGAGKSTLLRLIAGLERPDSGTVEIAGRDVTRLPPHARNVGLLGQRPAIYPHLDVRRNLSIGLEMWQSRQRKSAPGRDEIRRRVDECVELLELGALLGRRPSELSGGEQQRLALGRILVRRAPVWLLDEPLNHLDAARKIEFRRHLHLLRDSFPATILLVTHDPVEALTLGQRLAVLDGGRLRQVDSPAAVYALPADRFVAGFLGWPPLNLTDGVLVRVNDTDGGLRFAAADGSFHLPVPAELVTHGAEGQPVAVGIRPEDLEPSAPSPPHLPEGRIVLRGWHVVRAEFAPPRWLVSIRLGRQEWRLWHGEPPPAPGEAIDVKLPCRRLHWFDGQTGQRLNVT